MQGSKQDDYVQALFVCSAATNTRKTTANIYLAKLHQTYK